MEGAGYPQMKENLRSVHPVIRVHPETGRKALFVDELWTERIIELEWSESDYLLRMLFDHIKSPRFMIRWHWKPNDIALWDNRAFQHYAVSDYHGKRVMQKVILEGDRPCGPRCTDARRVESDDLQELNQLVYRYAAAVDACDVEAFLDTFHSDARLRTYHPDSDEPFTDFVGHDKLASVPNTMRQMFRRTAHQMTNHLVDVDGDTATGSLLCTARHLSTNPDDRAALVVVIRYVDRYDRRAGRWRISDRQIRFLWSERHPVVDSGF
jgi:3-phenylpropionate/cinnamic acid dioxygenase small subunit